MYADIADVIHELGELGDYLTATSRPTKTDVEGKTLPAIAGEIDGVLGARGLTVPITQASLVALGVDAAAATRFLETLSSLNALGAAARAVAALFPNRAGPGGAPFHEWLQQRYDAGLTRLGSGEGVPSASVASSALPRSHWTSNPTDPDTDEDWAPIFTRRGTLW